MEIKTSPDKQKANALLKMAQVTLERLQETNFEKYPSNTLIDYYDIIHKLLDSIACVKGVKFKGDGAHQQLIDYVCEKYLSPKEKIFLQQMRDYRNRIQYEGFIVSVNYISINLEFINKIIFHLIEVIKKD